MLEKVIVDNSIPITKSFINNSGDTVLVCDSADTTDKLKEAISASSENVEMKFYMKRKSSITIVGLSRMYKKEELVHQLVMQNQCVKHFSAGNNINEHLEIHDKVDKIQC